MGGGRRNTSDILGETKKKSAHSAHIYRELFRKIATSQLKTAKPISPWFTLYAGYHALSSTLIRVELGHAWPDEPGGEGVTPGAIRRK